MLDDEEPEQASLIDAETLHFNFLIDRSYSMSGLRIKQAREALVLFLRSLPLSCRFSIISFGTTAEYLTINGMNVITYNEENA